MRSPPAWVSLTAGFDVCLAPWSRDVHADHEAAGRAARRVSERTLCYPVWMWHWAVPGDPRVPWHRALRVSLPAAVAARKRAAIACFTSQLESRGGGARAGAVTRHRGALHPRPGGALPVTRA